MLLTFIMFTARVMNCSSPKLLPTPDVSPPRHFALANCVDPDQMPQNVASGHVSTQFPLNIGFL